MAQCRELSRQFVGRNIEQAKNLGAKRIIIFCSPCYPIYRHAFAEENIVFYPAVINELINPVILKEKIDYYAGCCRLHKKFSPAPMDLKSTNDILNKIEGLEVNRISAPKCCYHPEGLTHMTTSVMTGTMLYICAGCYSQALRHMPRDKGVDVLMLPDFVERVMARGEAV